jgi:hypothetical protein
MACSTIHRMTQLGLPITQRIRSETKPGFLFVSDWIYAPTL